MDNLRNDYRLQIDTTGIDETAPGVPIYYWITASHYHRRDTMQRYGLDSNRKTLENSLGVLPSEVKKCFGKLILTPAMIANTGQTTPQTKTPTEF